MSHPSVVTRIYGEVAGDGGTISLQLQTRESISEIALAKDDIAGFVHMLLALVSESELRPAKDPEELGSHLPAHSLWVGETNSGDGLLGLQIGAVKLTFSLPREQLGHLGRALLCASASNALPT